MAKYGRKVDVLCAFCGKPKQITFGKWENSENKVFTCSKDHLAKWMENKKKKLTHNPRKRELVS